MTNEQEQRFAELRKKTTVKGKGDPLRNMTEEERKELATLYKLRKAEDREKFGDKLIWLTKLLFQHDPISLVKMGVPKDEYEPEARMILHALERNPPTSEKEIQHVVFDIFLEMFGNGTAGEPYSAPYNAIAEAIFIVYKGCSQR